MLIIYDGIDRPLSRGFNTIKIVCHHLNLNDEVEEIANIIFKLVEQSKKLKGRHHDAVVSAIIFIACRGKKQSRSLSEIADVLNCDKRAVSKCYGLIRKEIPQTSNVKSPVDYAVRFATKVAFSQEMKNQVQNVAEKLVDEGILAGKNPKSIAGAAVYFVGIMNPRDRVTFGEVAEVSRMAEATIKSAYREIEQYQGELKMLLGLV